MGAMQGYVGYIAIAVAVVVAALVVLAFVKKGFQTTISTMGQGAGLIVGIVLLIYPILLYWLGAALPGLHQPVQGFWFPAEALNGVIVVGGIGVVIIFANTLVAFFSEKVFQLVTNLLINAVFAVALPTYAGVKYGAGTLMYYQELSALVAVLGLVITAIASIGGAWNKNPTQVTKGTI